MKGKYIMKKSIKSILSLVLSAIIASQAAIPTYAQTVTSSEDELILPTSADSGLVAEYITDEEAELLIAQIEEDTKNSVYEYEIVNQGFTNDTYGCDFYYNQLSADQKTLYENLVIETEKVLASDTDFTERTYTTLSHNLDADTLYEAFHAFYYDNPQYFFISQGIRYNSSIVMPFLNEDFLTSSERAIYAATIKSVADTWIPQIKTGKNALEKEKIIYTLLCQKIDYVVTTKDQSLAGAIVDGQCVCNGYAMAFTYFANAVGLDTVAVTGQNHAWNIVKLFGDWYNIDVTWMDQDWGIWTALLNVSNSEMLSVDVQQSSNAHTLRSEYYISRTPPACVKSDPILPVLDKPIVEFRAAGADNTIALVWTDVDYAEQYTVFKYSNGAYETVITTTDTSCIIDDITNFAQYGYLVRAYSADIGWSDFTTADVVYCPSNLLPKPSVTAKAKDASVQLSWDTVNGATKYAVYSYLNGSYSAAGTTTANSYTVKNLTNGTKYGFLVRAYVGGTWTSFTTADLVYAAPVSAAKPVVTTAALDSSVKLTWKSLSGATKYAVYSYLNGKYTAAGTTTGTTYTVKNLTNGTKYGFLVRAYVNGEWTSFTTSDNVYCTPVMANAKPAVTAVSNDASVQLTWNPLNGATKYAVYSYLNGSYTAVGTTTGTSYTVKNLTNGTKYGFLVRANINGTWTSFTTADNVYCTPNSSKPVVTAAAMNGSVKLTWKAPVGATKYAVYSYLNGKYSAVGTTTGTSYTVKNLINGTKYGFLVRACVNGNWTSFTTADLVYSTPVLKPVVTATAKSGEVQLTWKALDGATKYAVYSYLDGKYSAVGTTTSTSYTVKNLVNGTNYGFLVRACVNGTWTDFTTADLVYATPNA